MNRRTNVRTAEPRVTRPGARCADAAGARRLVLGVAATTTPTSRRFSSWKTRGVTGGRRERLGRSRFLFANGHERGVSSFLNPGPAMTDATPGHMSGRPRVCAGSPTPPGTPLDRPPWHKPVSKHPKADQVVKGRARGRRARGSPWQRADSSANPDQAQAGRSRVQQYVRRAALGRGLGLPPTDCWAVPLSGPRGVWPRPCRSRCEPQGAPVPDSDFAHVAQ